MLLLDTHAFVWLASDSTRLTQDAKQAIRTHADDLHLSSISALEIGLLVKRERLDLPVAPGAFIERALEQHGVEEVMVDREIALASVGLPDLHNDPFDRIIIATALAGGMSILTKDTVIPTYPGVKTIW
jgi:PIN domain nuclease of toxin-antitoxin system